MNNDSTKIYDNLKDLEQAAKEIISRNILPKLIKHNQTSAAEFVSSFSKGADDFILQTERDEGLNFVAGYAILNLLESGTIQIDFDFYFQNTQGSWINKKKQSKTFNVDEYLNPQAQASLLEHQSLKFDIDKPLDR
ncbi:hypothetical protein [Moraxella catarrhalis]|jgi:hypothetical protein|uniref:hypothetical protein n=1 Tax=Moraxella catarrhalis TaxID=480 RepID=UPI000EAA8E64|nr:hypothetical protein [Moraxella catarrhalis]MPW69465.1 hypothetical protein [Moraxella catarrhalis]MPX15315.1 hypothetical protein [Moraxella catarrhalis]MPX37610.1 hypothetical protein [Moraxella catarrhalis]RKM12407.1 hypothetical protein D6D59_01210 [Moraxella catarrhalis]RKM14203.1 hypothetical protein D6D83_01250 [Moraxella catarrhalis]